MKQRISKQWRQGLSLPVTALTLCATLTLCVALTTACRQDDYPALHSGEPLAVTFTASVEQAAMPSATPTGNGNAPGTRTTGTGSEWLPTDRAGIFMLSSGGLLTTATHLLADNVQHTATPSTPASLASFVPATAGEAIYYPKGSSTVDFVAYHPWRATPAADPYIYKVSVANQDNPAAISLLYARTTGVSRSAAPVGLQFSHKMSKVTLNLTAGEDILPADVQNLPASGITFSGMPTQAEVALQDGTLTPGANLSGTFHPLKATTPQGAAHATFSAILVPQPTANAYTGRTVVFTLNGETYTWTIPGTEVFLSGEHYTYPVRVGKAGITVGTPTISLWNENDRGTHRPDVSDEVKVDGIWMRRVEGVLYVRIPAGTFLMGSSDGSAVSTGTPGVHANATPAEPERFPYENQHWVKLTRDFYLSRCEITNAQYAAFLNEAAIGSNGEGSVTYLMDNSATPVTETRSFVSASSGARDWGLHWETDKWVPAPGYENHPVIQVSWYGAKAYADWVGGELPTEAQWERAARGGEANRPFGVGDGYTLDNTLANFVWTASWSWDGVSPNATMWSSGGSSYPDATQAVGTYPANAYGLRDMHGNVWEWCLDQWNGSDLYPEAATEADAITDPLGTSGSNRVYRGGSWGYLAYVCRSALHLSNGPTNSFIDLGFRVVLLP